MKEMKMINYNVPSSDVVVKNIVMFSSEHDNLLRVENTPMLPNIGEMVIIGGEDYHVINITHSPEVGIVYVDLSNVGIK